MRRASVVLSALVSLVAWGALPAAPALAGGGAHPCFNDRGTLPWYRSLVEAQAAARASDKLIFVESGRLECSQCRRLVAGILPYEPVRSRMNAVAIGFADDCDEMDPTVKALFDANLPYATMLPLVAFLTPDLRWVTGWSGGTVVGSVEQQLSIAEGVHRQLVSARAAESRPPPCAAKSPTSVPSGPSPAPVAVPTPAPIARAPTTTIPPAPRPVAAPVPPSTPRLATGPAPAATNASPAAPAPLVAKPTPAAPVVPPPTPAVRAPAPLASAQPAAPSPDSLSTPARSVPPPFVLPPPARGASAAPPASPSAVAVEPVRPPATRVATPIERARAAAARESWGEVIRIADREGPEGDSPEAAEFSGLMDRACAWMLRTMLDAERSAADHRPTDARRTLERMKRELDGTECPALVDADRGLRAMDALAAIESGSENGTPSGPDGAESLRRRAYAEFRGSRWAPLFRSR